MVIVVAFSAAPPATGDTFKTNYRLSAVASHAAGDQVDYNVDGLILGSYTNDTAYPNYSNELDYNAAESNQFDSGTCGTVSPYGPRRWRGGP